MTINRNHSITTINGIFGCRFFLEEMANHEARYFFRVDGRPKGVSRRTQRQSHLEKTRVQRIGAMKGKLTLTNDIDTSLPEDVLDSFELRNEHLHTWNDQPRPVCEFRLHPPNEIVIPQSPPRYLQPATMSPGDSPGGPLARRTIKPTPKLVPVLPNPRSD